MNIHSIAVRRSDNTSALEREINQVLDLLTADPNVDKIIDIKYSSSQYQATSMMTAMIIYTHCGEKSRIINE